MTTAKRPDVRRAVESVWRALEAQPATLARFKTTRYQWDKVLMGGEMKAHEIAFRVSLIEAAQKQLERNATELAGAIAHELAD